MVDNKSMLMTSEDMASVGVFHELIAITGVLEDCLQAVARPKVDLNSALCMSVLDLFHNVFRCWL